MQPDDWDDPSNPEGEAFEDYDRNAQKADQDIEDWERLEEELEDLDRNEVELERKQESEIIYQTLKEFHKATHIPEELQDQTAWQTKLAQQAEDLFEQSEQIRENQEPDQLEQLQTLKNKAQLLNAWKHFQEIGQYPHPRFHEASKEAREQLKTGFEQLETQLEDPDYRDQLISDYYEYRNQYFLQ